MTSSWRWATVTALAPLRIQLDGDDSPLSITPDSLLDDSALSIGARVLVHLWNRQITVMGQRNLSTGVTGILSIANGGTGAATAEQALANSGGQPLGTMNGDWYERLLSGNTYEWIQMWSTPSVAVNVGWGSLYYATVDLPAKPTGATITSVNASVDAGSFDVWTIQKVNSWQATLLRTGTAATAAIYSMTIRAIGTKSAGEEQLFEEEQ